MSLEECLYRLEKDARGEQSLLNEYKDRHNHHHRRQRKHAQENRKMNYSEYYDYDYTHDDCKDDEQNECGVHNHEYQRTRHHRHRYRKHRYRKHRYDDHREDEVSRGPGYTSEVEDDTRSAIRGVDEGQDEEAGIEQCPVVIVECRSRARTDHERHENVTYMQRCLKDSLMRGESPVALEYLYTQPNVLDNERSADRALANRAIMRFYSIANIVAVYEDREFDANMRKRLLLAKRFGVTVEYRGIDCSFPTVPGEYTRAWHRVYNRSPRDNNNNGDNGVGSLSLPTLTRTNSLRNLRRPTEEKAAYDMIYRSLPTSPRRALPSSVIRWPRDPPLRQMGRDRHLKMFFDNNKNE